MSEAMRETVTTVGATNSYNATVDLLERNLARVAPNTPISGWRTATSAIRRWPQRPMPPARDCWGWASSAATAVIVAMRDRPEFVFAFWGAIKAGLVPVPIAQGLSSSDIQFMLSDSGARAVLCDPSSAPKVMPAVVETGATALVAGGRVDGEGLGGRVRRGCVARSS